MKHIKKISIIGLIVILLAISFTVGRTTAPEKIIEKEIMVGAKCPTIAQSLKSLCNCPSSESVLEVGCVKEIDAKNVNVKNATKIKIDGKKYNVEDIKRDVAETSIIKYVR